MNSSIAVLPGKLKFRTSIPGAIAAILLVGAFQSIVLALVEFLRPVVIHLINLGIARGHFRFYPIAEERITWLLVILNLLIGMIGLCLSCWLANWNYLRRSNT